MMGLLLVASIIIGADISASVADLKNDEVRWNAIHAMSKLTEAGPEASSQLEVALSSTDHQQRQLACHLLRRITQYTPTQNMLRVSVEGLRHNSLPESTMNGQRTSYTVIFNASRGITYLLQHTQLARPYLINGLRSDDHQQQFLCAYILGCSSETDAISLIAPILIPHLRNNHISNDAVMSAHALYRLGDPVRPYLENALPHTDKQQVQLIRLILLDISDPPKNNQDLKRRSTMHEVSDIAYDPVIDHNFMGIGWRYELAELMPHAHESKGATPWSKPVNGLIFRLILSHRSPYQGSLQVRNASDHRIHIMQGAKYLPYQIQIAKPDGQHQHSRIILKQPDSHLLRRSNIKTILVGQTARLLNFDLVHEIGPIRAGRDKLIISFAAQAYTVDEKTTWSGEVVLSTPWNHE